WPPAGRRRLACVLACADGGQASRSCARRGRALVFSTTVVTVAGSPRRTRGSPPRRTRRARTGAASATSGQMAAKSSPSMTATVTSDLTASTIKTPAAATAAARPLSVTVGSPGDRDGGQQPVQQALWSHALQFGLGAELHPVPQRGPREGLHVVGDH